MHHGCCAVCGQHAGWSEPFGADSVWIRLEVAHILGGRYGRVDDPRNLLLLCGRLDGRGCHQSDQGGGLTLPLKLAAKRRVDPELYDRAFLQGRLGRPLPRAADLSALLKFASRNRPAIEFRAVLTEGLTDG